jgi:hypothetical protein
MKKIALSLFGFILFTSCFKEKQAELKFDSEVIKIDTILQGKVIDTAFVFENTGTADLVIKSAKASCGCTIADYPKKPIPPGEKGKIKVTFKSAGRRGTISKVITVESNASEAQRFVVLKTYIKPVKFKVTGPTIDPSILNNLKLN